MKKGLFAFKMRMKEGFDFIILKERIEKGLKSMGCELVDCEIREDTSEVALFKEKISKGKIYKVSYNVIGENIDFRQVEGELSIINIKLDTFIIESKDYPEIY